MCRLLCGDSRGVEGGLLGGCARRLYGRYFCGRTRGCKRRLIRRRRVSRGNCSRSHGRDKGGMCGRGHCWLVSWELSRSRSWHIAGVCTRILSWRRCGLGRIRSRDECGTVGWLCRRGNRWMQGRVFGRVKRRRRGRNPRGHTSRNNGRCDGRCLLQVHKFTCLHVHMLHAHLGWGAQIRRSLSSWCQRRERSWDLRRRQCGKGRWIRARGQRGMLGRCRSHSRRVGLAELSWHLSRGSSRSNGWMEGWSQSRMPRRNNTGYHGRV